MALAPPQQTRVLDRRGHVHPAWHRYFVNQGKAAGPVPVGIVFLYRADAVATTAADPGAGFLRWNNATQASATSIYFDWLTTDGLDVHLLFMLMNGTSRFLIQDADLAVQYQVWAMTGDAINHPDWFEVPVTLVASAGGPFSNNQRLAVAR